MSDFQPAYLKLSASGELAERARQANAALQECNLCAWCCRKDRLSGKLGVCQTGAHARLASYGPHFGEESPLRGRGGSGTIFFAGCNLRCQYCQNYDISQGTAGNEVESQELAAIMLELQAYGCHNINFVSPSHVVPQILAAVAIAAMAGLRLPLVYNTGGYDSLLALALMDGVIDIYMPDMKYASSKIGQVYSKVRDYPLHNQAAVREMHRQVGDLRLDAHGLAVRGLLVRHLVLPNDLAGTETIVAFLAQEISTNTYLNLMDQYRPAFNARQFAKLGRPIKAQEFSRAVELAHTVGLFRLDHAV